MDRYDAQSFPLNLRTTVPIHRPRLGSGVNSVDPSHSGAAGDYVNPDMLRSAGTGLDKVAQVNIFITDFGLLPAMNEVYAGYFPHRPAKTSVEISRLDKGALIEVEAIAAA